MNWKQLCLYAAIFFSLRAVLGFAEGLLFPSPHSVLWGAAVSFAVAFAVFAHFCLHQRSQTLPHAALLVLSAAAVDIAIYQATLHTALSLDPFETALGWAGLLLGAFVGTSVGIASRGDLETPANVA